MDAVEVVRAARLSVACALAASVISACSSGDSSSSGDPEPTAAAPTPTPAPTPAADAPLSDEPVLGVDALVVPVAAPTMPAPWQERFVIGYGRGKQLLGTAPGGDSGSLDIGPEYGAPGADGSWWFLDAAKARVVHYDPTGHYLDQVGVGPLLVGGRYFQWQLPHVLADGALVATRNSPAGTMLMRVRDGRADEIPVVGLERGQFFAPVYDDGRLLYGYVRRGRMVVVDPATGSVRPATALRTPSGTPFAIKVGGRLELELPERGISRVLPISSPAGAPAHVGVQVRAGADDTLHLFLMGIGEDDESVQLVGATTVSPAGEVTQLEPLADPFSEADPGSPAQLVMAPGSSTPMLVYVLDDGVHVYERSTH